MKKVLSVMLSMLMLLPLCNGMTVANATEAPSGTPISTVEEFLNMDVSGVYYLANDIDFSGKTYTKNVYAKTFKGVLDGNGHALLGITVEAQNSDAGIFGNQFSGVLRNLTFGAPDAPVSVSSTGAGYSVAVIAGTVKGGATFENVTIYANVKGDGKTAGFTSYMPDGKMTIAGSKVYGTVSGNPAAGFVTMADNGSSEIEITNCENHASITGKNLSAGGIYSNHANVGGSRKCNLTIRGCVNYGAITASDWRVGGIVGEFTEEKSSTLTVEYCYNLGPVTMTGGGGYAAGIVGGMCFDSPGGARRIANVYNAGLIRNTANTGNAFAIAYAQNAGDNVTVENAAYQEGTASKNCVEANVELVADQSAMLATVSKYPDGGDGLSFIADTGNINDGYPILAAQNLSHENVHTYSCGRTVCLDCDIILSLPENEKHSYNKTTTAPEGYLDGYITSVCKYCSDTKIVVNKASAYQVKPVDGVYTLTNPDHLMWYAANQNAGLLIGNETVKLGADLDMKDLQYTPIAFTGKAFTGKFDGCGYTIRNLTIDVEGDAGLFAKLGLGAEIKNLALTDATVKATGSAGAVAGSVVTGAVVKFDCVSVTDSTVTSTNAVAGGLMGTSNGATDVTVHGAVCDGVTVSGTSAGGVLGNGNSALLRNVYANAKLTATSGKTGALATYSAGFSVKFAGYSRSTVADQMDGTAYDDNAFASGEIAYLINTFGARKAFGIVDGKTSVSDAVVKMIRRGSQKIYTDKILSAGDGTAVYALPSEGGLTLAIVQVQNADERLVDSKITVAGNEIAFKDLSICKYVSSGDAYYVAAEGCVLYTLPIANTSAPIVVIGSSFNGTAENING
ncbi:MAG: hypothetical protein IJX47_06580 [Clostridia bacterium]|nr:hypothetical protein [Clostridia bacterium]